MPKLTTAQLLKTSHRHCERPQGAKQSQGRDCFVAIAPRNDGFIFILGGARSGKSAYALNLAKARSRKVIYIATAQAGDSEMKYRISRHKASRPRYWKTIEEPLDLIAALEKHKHKYEVIIIDCLTLYLSNLMHKGLKQGAIIKIIKEASSCIKAMKETVIVISNEVGLGIVPENKLAREFRDIAGLANQIMAKAADEVVFLQAGIALKLK